LEIPNVSEQDAAQTSTESSSSGIVSPASPGPNSEPVAASVPAPVDHAPEIDALHLVSGQGAAVETHAKAEAPKPEAPRTEPKADEPGLPGNIMIMPAREQDGDHRGGGPEEQQPHQGALGKRRLSAMAAIVALAAATGALGGALATAALSHVARNEVAKDENGALQASVTRIEADILALNSTIEHTSKAGIAQFNKTSERVDKLEKAQAEPTAKIAKLSGTVDKLRAASPAPAAAPVAAAQQEVTGSIAPARTTAVPPKLEVARLPTLEGWLLREVAHGGALIEGRRGYYVVYAGDAVPGLGRVDAIRRQDGRWVVVTTKGLVVAR
jgi:cell division protein FtsB